MAYQLDRVENEMISSGSMGSRMYYAGTETEVRLGDRVRLRRWLRRDLDAVVCYIPGLSPKHRELEYEDVRLWAVRASNGCLYPILYDPEHFQPPKRVVFLERGDVEPLDPSEVLDELEEFEQLEDAEAEREST